MRFCFVFLFKNVKKLNFDSKNIFLSLKFDFDKNCLSHNSASALLLLRDDMELGRTGSKNRATWNFEQ